MPPSCTPSLPSQNTFVRTDGPDKAPTGRQFVVFAPGDKAPTTPGADRLRLYDLPNPGDHQGMTRAGLAAIMLLAPCAPARETPHAESRGVPARCDLEPNAACGAEGLPRITEKDVDVRRLVERARSGTVAVRWGDGKAALVPECRLAGAYVEIAGEPGSGRFWASERALFRTDEIDASCGAATHAVAAFARAGARFTAILVPLPCPASSDPAPAKGCVGRGLSGPQRRELARTRRELEAYALVPDDDPGLAALQAVRRKEPRDCALAAQAEWVLKTYVVTENGFVRDPAPSAPPRFDMGASARTCFHRPPFLQCFGGLFDPASGGSACWRPAP